MNVGQAAAHAAEDARAHGGRGPPGRRPAPVSSVVVAVPAAPAPAPVEEIDREKTCPLLLRVFPKVGDHHNLNEYQSRGREPPDEVQIYTWPDATLREITELVKEVRPEARGPQARVSFAFVYPDRRGFNVMRPVGQCMSVRRGDDDDKSLKSLNFQTGDFLDVAIHPLRSGGGPEGPRGGGIGGFGGGGGGGYGPNGGVWGRGGGGPRRR